MACGFAQGWDGGKDRLAFAVGLSSGTGNP